MTVPTPTLILVLLMFIVKVISVQIFNITENHVPERLINVYDIFQIPKGDKNIILRDVELIIDHSRSNLEINRRTGDIMVKTIFDREDICPSRMTDDCILNYLLSYKSTLKDFKVLIKDTNDNAPMFKDKIKEINIREGENDKIEYLLPRATDADTAVFGIDTYTVKFYDDEKNSDHFNEYLKLIIHRNKDQSITPMLKVIKLLDRERVEKMSFTLIAWDKNQKSGDCKIIVNVIDINDNTPTWITDPYNIEIKQCSQSREIMKLEAHDQDDVNTDNGRLTYEIGEKTRTNNKISNLFYISGNMLCIDPLKLTEIDIYEFEIEVIAKDGGGRFSVKNINVKILDCNKNKPQITITHRNPKIIENETKSVKLTNVIVNDPDRGLNGDFDCVLDDTQRFSLVAMVNRNQKSGKWTVYTLNTVEGFHFDREKIAIIPILITCTDKGIPSQFEIQKVSVHIVDINDNAPIFTRSIYTFSVSENVHIGIIVGIVTAVDNDSNENGRIFYEIDSTLKENFSINNKGQIQTNGELDREKISSYKFKVIAKDNGEKPMSGSCIVKIFVIDVNDCSPEVEKQFIFTIMESRGSSQIHLNLGRIEAKDADSGLNGTLNFKILSSHAREFGKSLLQITSDGYLSIFGNVDRETMKTIHFEVIVSDNGKPSLSTITTVIVNILDLNDNKPKFVFPNYAANTFINISLQSPVGTVLAVIEATDADNGNNGSVFYKLMGGEHINSFFDLHQTGQLILIKSLAEKRLNPERLLIQALDRGEPPLSETTTLYLRYFSNKELSAAKFPSEKRMENVVKLDKDHLKESANVTLLYGLAAVLFIIFFVALIALCFVYLKSRTHMNQDFNSEKNIRGRKNYSQKFQESLREHKGNDELLDKNLCETADPMSNPRDNYTNLMFIKDPHYNLLYPRTVSKSDIELQNDHTNTLNYFPYQNQPDVSMGSNSMRMLVNNLSPQSSKAPLLLSNQSNPLLTYKDSIESLADYNYNTASQTIRDKTTGTKDDNRTFVPTSSGGYTQPYVTSTFV